MKLLHSEVIAIQPEVVTKKYCPKQIKAVATNPDVEKKECFPTQQKIQPRKRKIASASFLATSFKMSVAASSSSSKKRTKVSKEEVVKESFSALVALHAAIDQITDNNEALLNHKSVPDKISSLPCSIVEGPNKRLSTSETLGLLHKACIEHPKNKHEVKSALVLDPKGIMRRSKALVSTGMYSLPINVALKHEASTEVLDLLVSADPSVVSLQDGYDNSASLNIALRTRPTDIEVIRLLVVSNPLAIAIADSRGNYPIHVACACGSTFDVVHLLYSLYPEACSKRNMHGETPLAIAKRNKCLPKIFHLLCKASTNNYEEMH